VALGQTLGHTANFRQRAPEIGVSAGFGGHADGLDCSRLVRMAAHSTAKDTAPNPKKTQAPAPDLHDPSLYVNRELGLLSFQWRVLEEARDATNPLLE